MKASTFGAILGKPRSILQRWDFDPILSESRNWSNKELQGRELHAEDSHKDNSLSEKAAKKSYEAGNCELHKTKFKQLIANAYMIFQRMRRRGVHTQGKRRGVGCTNALTQLVIILRDESELRFKISTQRHHRDSEQKRASGHREEKTHTSDDWWKAKLWTESWWEKAKRT